MDNNIQSIGDDDTAATTPIATPVVTAPPKPNTPAIPDNDGDSPTKAPIPPELPYEVSQPKNCLYCKVNLVIDLVQRSAATLILFAIVYFLLKQANNGRGQ